MLPLDGERPGMLLFMLRRLTEMIAYLALLPSRIHLTSYIWLLYLGDGLRPNIPHSSIVGYRLSSLPSSPSFSPHYVTYTQQL